jgi:hypothetical protein
MINLNENKKFLENLNINTYNNIFPIITVSILIGLFIIIILTVGLRMISNYPANKGFEWFIFSNFLVYLSGIFIFIFIYFRNKILEKFFDDTKNHLLIADENLKTNYNTAKDLQVKKIYYFQEEINRIQKESENIKKDIVNNLNSIGSLEAQITDDYLIYQDSQINDLFNQTQNNYEEINRILSWKNIDTATIKKNLINGIYKLFCINKECNNNFNFIKPILIASWNILKTNKILKFYRNNIFNSINYKDFLKIQNIMPYGGYKALWCDFNNNHSLYNLNFGKYKVNLDIFSANTNEEYIYTSLDIILNDNTYTLFREGVFIGIANFVFSYMMCNGAINLDSSTIYNMQDRDVILNISSISSSGKVFLSVNAYSKFIFNKFNNTSIGNNDIKMQENQVVLCLATDCIYIINFIGFTIKKLSILFTDGQYLNIKTYINDSQQFITSENFKNYNIRNIYNNMRLLLSENYQIQLNNISSINFQNCIIYLNTEFVAIENLKYNYYIKLLNGLAGVFINKDTEFFHSYVMHAQDKIKFGKVSKELFKFSKELFNLGSSLMSDWIMTII